MVTYRSSETNHLQTACSRWLLSSSKANPIRVYYRERIQQYHHLLWFMLNSETLLKQAQCLLCLLFILHASFSISLFTLGVLMRTWPTNPLCNKTLQLPSNFFTNLSSPTKKANFFFLSLAATTFSRAANKNLNWKENLHLSAAPSPWLLYFILQGRNKCQPFQKQLSPRFTKREPIKVCFIYHLNVNIFKSSAIPSHTFSKQYHTTNAVNPAVEEVLLKILHNYTVWKTVFLADSPLQFTVRHLKKTGKSFLLQAN